MPVCAGGRRHHSVAGLLRGMAYDRDGTSAIEFSIVAMPFFLLLIGVFQMGVYYITQSSLDAGVIQTADSLVNTFSGSTAPVMPTAAALQALVASKSGGMVHNDTSLTVELREFSLLSAGPLAITNVVDTSVANDVLVLRAQSTVPSFLPGFSGLMVRSSAIVRRQGL